MRDGENQPAKHRYCEGSRALVRHSLRGKRQKKMTRKVLRLEVCCIQTVHSGPGARSGQGAWIFAGGSGLLGDICKMKNKGMQGRGLLCKGRIIRMQGATEKH